MKFYVIEEKQFDLALASIPPDTAALMLRLISEPEPVTFYCDLCGRSIYYQDCPTGGWWIHDVHFGDNHDAVCGGYGTDDE